MKFSENFTGHLLHLVINITILQHFFDAKINLFFAKYVMNITKKFDM